MDTKHKFWCELVLAPGHRQPAHEVKIFLDQDLYHSVTVHDRISLAVQAKLEQGWHDLRIEFRGKTEQDAHQALKIVSLTINGIKDQRFVWNAVYQPAYPEPWASQQRDAGVDLAASITNIDFLGWNGVWSLTFYSPAFTWIHQTQNLGWIYL